MKRPHSSMGRLLVASCGCFALRAAPVEAFTTTFAHQVDTPRASNGASKATSPSSSNPRRRSSWLLSDITTSPPVDRRTFGEDDDDRDVTDVLLSYRSNIRRASTLSQEESKKPIRSLVHFLEQQQRQRPSTTTFAPQIVVESVLPGLQVAAKWNDYRLLLQLWEATKSFCRDHPTVARDALPRLFGETVTCLGKTSASLSKIKKLWKTDSPSVATPRETNAYLKLILAADKPRLALNVWQAERAHGRTNAYSLALVLQALQNSTPDKVERRHDDSSAGALLDETDDNQDGVLATPFAAWKTQSWQWNEAVNLLEHDYLLRNGAENEEEDDDNDDVATSDATEWTNPVVSALLQLNHRLGSVDRRHPESALAEAIWDFFVLEKNSFCLASPDVRTCTSFLNCLRKDWSMAVDLLRSMQTGKHSLPPPNVYTYAATLACCARAGQYQVAWDLLNEDMVTPNTVVYNTVLSALATFARSNRPTRAQRDQTRDRLSMGLSLLSRIQDTSKNGTACSADTVTYNTLLQIASGGVVDTAGWEHILKTVPHHFGYESTRWPLPERLVHSLLDQMEEADVSRDELTYRNAISCVRSFQGVIQLVGRALKDDSVKGAAKIFDAAMFVLAQEGDLDGIQLVLSKMIREGSQPTGETLLSVIRGLGQSGNTRSIPFLILALMGNQEASEHLFAVHGLDLNVKRLPPLASEHLTTAITSCLYQNDFGNARRILVHLRDVGLEPSDESLEVIARSYARLALDLGRDRKISENAISRARNAYGIVQTLEGTPPLSLLAVVTRACATTGLFASAQKLLRKIHQEYLAARSGSTVQAIVGSALSSENELITGLHRAVLKSTADLGNITFALRIAEDIQRFDRDCEWGQLAYVEGDDGISWKEVNDQGDVLPTSVLFQDDALTPSRGGLGMKAVEWNFVLEAAAKSGHWKVCINTLQFLSPYVISTQPLPGHDKDDRERLNAEYKSMSKGLVSAAKCFAMRSQYGWAVRAIEDWILWSGRRPPKEAVQLCIRILSTRGRGDEVHRLLTSCLQPAIQDPCRDGRAYEVTLFVNAITALYKTGLYDAADDVFVAAVSSGVFPFQLEKQEYGAETRITLDLHGMNSAVAHSAVRCALQQEVLTNSWNSTELRDKDMVIVTGRGKKSALHMRPILRPEVQRMLIEEFYPPLSTTSVPGNMGALRLSSEEIYEWVDHQRQQKGVRMLAVAAVLRDFSSARRLSKALTKAALRKD